MDSSTARATSPHPPDHEMPAARSTGKIKAAPPKKKKTSRKQAGDGKPPKRRDASKALLGARQPSNNLQRLLKGFTAGAAILPHMPPELVQMIASHLPANSFKSLRLVCRELESKTLWLFADKHFKQVPFMLSRHALEALVAMSASRMGQYVRTVTLGPLSKDQGLIHVVDKNMSTLDKSNVRETMSRYAQDQRLMRMLGEDAAMIQHAFRNLQGVTKLEFLDEFLDRCECCPPAAYGVRYFHEHICRGEAAHFDKGFMDGSQSMARVFTIALRAAELAGLRLECIDCSIPAIAGANASFECISTGFAAMPIDFPVPSLASNPRLWAFEKLTVLRIFLGFEAEAQDDSLREIFLGRLTSFMARAPLLHTLGVTTSLGPCGGSIFKDLTATDAMKKMTTFELCGLVTCTHTLEDIFKPLSKTLRALKLDKILLYSPGWVEILEYIRDKYTKLEEISISDMPDDILGDASYKGPDMDGFLEETIEEWSAIVEDMEMDMYDWDSDISY